MGKKLDPWKSLFSEEVFSTPWMSVFHDQFELPTGKKGNYFYLHTRGSSLVVPVNDRGEVLLVRQYRYLMRGESLELPCGGMKENQSEEDAARAELREETGYVCGRLKKIGRFVPYNGLSDEYCTVFLATRLSHVGTQPDETEQIEVTALPPSEIDAMIRKGKIIDGMSIAGWSIARSRLG
jgi:8-oxo-dGTP pyrophosphatase MutT (NUDIX family)